MNTQRTRRMPRNLQDAMSRATFVGKGLQLAWTASPAWTFAALLLTIVQGLLPVAMVYLTKYLVDGLARVIGQGVSWEVIQPVAIPTALMGLILLLSGAMESILAWVRVAQAEYVEDHVKRLVHKKASEVDLAFYESPEQLDTMQRANAEAGRRSLSVVQTVGELLRGTLTLLGVVGLVAVYSIWLAPLLLISALPSLWILLHHHKVHHNWWKATTPERRWTEYYDRTLTDSSAAAELRLFGLNDYFQEVYRALKHDLRQSRLKQLKDQHMAQQVPSMAAMLLTGGVMAWMVLRAMAGLATLGDLALFYQAFSRGQFVLWSQMRNVGRLYEDTLFLEHLFSFLSIQPQITDPAPEEAKTPALRHAIKMVDVHFAYPGSERDVLSGVDITIPFGKVVAVVGPNGAGKSTLLKLLCRFYDPKKGHLEVDGIDVRKIPLNFLRQVYTVLFQRPVNYTATAYENIAFGRFGGELDKEEIQRASVEAGAHGFLQKLHKGYETLLSKHFAEGTELSEGQKQRVALARAIFRQAPVVILDEPTSFMDPWAELEWLDRFYTYIKRANGTSVIITHRFTTAMRADIIYVMDGGKVVESGTHGELLKANGLYAESWNAQMQAKEDATEGGDGTLLQAPQSVVEYV